MTDRPVQGSEIDPLDVLAEEFVDRFRKGERPTTAEYAARYPELANRIQALFPALVEIEEAASISGPLAGSVAAASAVPEWVGEFRILRKIGEGGMGVVYEAVQESLGRHVALKVLSRRHDDTYKERFRREARTAAKLHHTNLVPVFAVGAASDVHYYAMQFIHGQGLDAVLQEVRALRAIEIGRKSVHRSATLTASIAQGLRSGVFAATALDHEAASPVASATSHSDLSSSSESRYFRVVAGLGAQAAAGLAYAHAQGVLHRDIKPSNLLLDTQGTLWIGDFGLSKADDSDDLTHSGDLVGTVRYMAPERFRGGADARSDVYSLGATLYEMLTLRPAFESNDRLELIERISRESPTRPRRHDPRIPRDLETVTQKAMAREPADRYPSAAALASDLNRFLEDRPIAARRLGPLGVCWRWCRRNPAVASLLWLLALLLVGGTIASSVAAYRYNQLARSERAARQATHEALRVADRHAMEAQEVIGFFIDDMIGAATPEKKLGRPVSVDEVLARADRAIEGKFPGQPLVEASIRQTLGEADQKLGRYDQAERHLTRARELRIALLGPEHPDTLALSNDLATVLRDEGRWEEARHLFERVGEARQRVLGPEHPDTLASLGYRALLARDRDDQEQARQLFGHLLEVRRRVLGPDHPSTLGTMNNLAFVLRYQGKQDQAGPLIDQVLEAQMRVLGPEHPKTLDALENRGHWLCDVNELDAAQTIYERVLRGRQRHYGPDHADVIEMQKAIASTLAGQGKWELASARYKDLLAARPDSCVARLDLALLDLRRGDLPGYRGHCAVVLRQIGAGVNPRDLAWAAKICSLLPGAVEDPTIPLELARRAVETTPTSPSLQLARGAAAYRAERFSEAVASLEKTRNLGIDLVRMREQADLFLAMALWRLDRHDEARRALAESDRLRVEWERTVPSHHGWPGFAWRDQLLVEITLREARAILGQATLPDDVSDRP
jgi:serine/threonine protein kinase/Flp pilus assembly protein TadD